MKHRQKKRKMMIKKTGRIAGFLFLYRGFNNAEKRDYWLAIDGELKIAREIMRLKNHVAVNVYRNVKDYKNNKIMIDGLIV